jgi:tetratricopeptide (TPR) repeat protein
MPDGLPGAIYYLRRSVDGFRTGSETQLNAYLYLGQALGTSGDRRQEEQVYRRALESFPDDETLLLRLGHLCQQSRRPEEAAACYRTILERGRTRVSAVHVRDGPAGAALRLGQLYVLMGQRPRAEQVWKDYLQAHPSAEAVREALERSYLDPCSIDAGPRP